MKKTNLSKLIKSAMQEEGVIKIQPEKKPRIPGAWTGQVTIADDFDDMPVDLVEYFHCHPQSFSSS